MTYLSRRELSGIVLCCAVLFFGTLVAVEILLGIKLLTTGPGAWRGRMGGLLEDVYGGMVRPEPTPPPPPTPTPTPTLTTYVPLSPLFSFLFLPGFEAVRAAGVFGGRDVDGVDAHAESPCGWDDELSRQV